MEHEKKWHEQYVTWQAFAIFVTLMIVGIGWAFVAVAESNNKLEKHIDAQASLNDTVTRMEKAQDIYIQSTTKFQDAVANKLNLTIAP